MLLNKEAIYLDINKNISIFRIREEYYNDIMCSINKNEILFNRICTDAYQVFINVFSKNLEKNYKLTEPSFYKDHILILNSIPSFLHDYYVRDLLNKGLILAIQCDGILIEKELIMNKCYMNQIDLNITCF